MKKISTIALCLAMGVMASAQQLEVNSPGGNLTRAGTNPTVGLPFNVTVGNNIDLRVGGGSTLPFILLYSDQGLATMSDSFGGIFGGQYLDLQQNGLQILVDAIGGLGLLPTGFGFTNAAGVANFSLPTNGTLINTEADFQAIVFDATLPFNLNFTAAACYQINSSVSFNGDDVQNIYTLPFGFNICGVSATQITVSTNGWMTFTAETGSDLSESAAEFINANPNATGIPSGSPMYAMDWEDLNMIAANGGLVTVNQPNASTITIQYSNGNYFGGIAWGSMNLTIMDLGGSTQFTADYTAYAPVTAPNEGIAGFSSGMAGATTTTADLSTMGAINPFASGPGPNNYFQSFDGVHTPVTGPAATPFDLGGQIMTTFVAPDCSIIVF